jgi:hypothetical protein
MKLETRNGVPLFPVQPGARQVTLEMVRELMDEEVLAEGLLAIRRDCAERLEEPYKSIEHGDLLYDERLPK